ncbi:MAG: alpha/beta hydrolase [Clostridia bacterium]|nr:alpha/beta hydrolase [Clostridia bacterium]
MKKLGKAVAAALGLGTATYALFGNVVDNLLVKRNWDLPESMKTLISGSDMTDLQKKGEFYEDWVAKYPCERFTRTTDDGVELVGWLMRPETPSDVYVFASHGYRSSGKHEFCAFAKYYIEHGINVFIVDHRGAGESGGKYIGFGYFEAPDSVGWLYWLKEHYGDDIKLILHGVSMGSATVMLMSGRDDLPENVKLIVADCGYTSAWNEFAFKLREMHVPEFPLMPVVNWLNKRVAGYDFRDTSALDSVRKTRVPMLFAHGKADAFVPFFMSEQNFEACGSEHKELLPIEGADHAAAFLTDQPKYEAKLDEMIEKYVLAPAETAAE